MECPHDAVLFVTLWLFSASIFQRNEFFGAGGRAPLSIDFISGSEYSDNQKHAGRKGMKENKSDFIIIRCLQTISVQTGRICAHE